MTAVPKPIARPSIAPALYRIAERLRGQGADAMTVLLKETMA
jgi:hypothetical protein